MLNATALKLWNRMADRDRWLGLAAWAGIFALAYLSMRLVAVPGSDWVHYFGIHQYVGYPPWIEIVLWPVRSLTVQNALTLTVLAYALWRYEAKPIHYLLAFTAMPLYWNLWLGQVDYMPLLGMIWLPWGLPLAAAKPQVAIWGALAWWLRRPDRWKIAVLAAAGLALSLVVYGLWPLHLSSPPTFYTSYNLSAWQWGGVAGGLVAVALALFMTFKARDIDVSMALGALASPYTQGNSYILLLPAFARLKGWPLLIAWAASWSGLFALLFDDAGRRLSGLFPIAMWVLLTWFASRPADADFRVARPSP